MHTYALRRFPVFLEGSIVEVDQRRESDRRAADYGKHQGEAVASGSDHGLGIAANANPYGLVPFRERRTEVLLGEWGAEPARPGHGLVSQQAHQQVELLLEEVLVIVEFVSEERE